MVYYRETAPLIGYYFCKGNLRTVDGMAPIAQVAKADRRGAGQDRMRNEDRGARWRGTHVDEWWQP